MQSKEKIRFLDFATTLCIVLSHFKFFIHQNDVSNSNYESVIDIVFNF